MKRLRFTNGNPESQQKMLVGLLSAGMLLLILLDSCGNPARADERGAAAAMLSATAGLQATADVTILEFWHPSGRHGMEITRGPGSGQLTCRLQLKGTREKRELDEPTIRSLVALLSQLAASVQPDSIRERITAILITAVSPHGQRTELLHRLQPSTRHTLLQQLQQLQTCLTLMTTIQQTPPAITLHPPAHSPAPTPTLM
ncbi:MAG: hypothetical protein ACK6D6_19115 [Planctomyces sp.]